MSSPIKVNLDINPAITSINIPTIGGITNLPIVFDLDQMERFSTFSFFLCVNQNTMKIQFCNSYAQAKAFFNDEVNE